MACSPVDQSLASRPGTDEERRETGDGGLGRPVLRPDWRPGRTRSGVLAPGDPVVPLCQDCDCHHPLGHLAGLPSTTLRDLQTGHPGRMVQVWTIVEDIIVCILFFRLGSRCIVFMVLPKGGGWRWLAKVFGFGGWRYLGALSNCNSGLGPQRTSRASRPLWRWVYSNALSY